MVHWLGTLVPDASEPLQLAVRSQHIRRWTSARSDYPEGRAGYKRWRSDLARMHAETTSAIMAEAGYDEEACAKASQILRKLKLKKDPEVQALEDAACLTFLELDLVTFMAKHDEAKVIDIVQKTWGKMSEQGHAAALELLASLPEDGQRLLEEALA